MTASTSRIPTSQNRAHGDRRFVNRIERDRAVKKILAWFEQEKPDQLLYIDLAHQLGMDHALARVTISELMKNGYIYRTAKRVFRPNIHGRTT